MSVCVCECVCVCVCVEGGRRNGISHGANLWYPCVCYGPYLCICGIQVCVKELLTFPLNRNVTIMKCGLLVICCNSV